VSHPEPGESGGPIVNSSGEIVGVIHGYNTKPLDGIFSWHGILPDRTVAEFIEYKAGYSLKKLGN
jgi:S1-C subfamily serine protease